MGKPNTQPRSPRAVVLAPTTELVQQVSYSRVRSWAAGLQAHAGATCRLVLGQCRVQALTLLDGEEGHGEGRSL